MTFFIKLLKSKRHPVEATCDTSQVRGELGAMWRHLETSGSHLEVSGSHLEADGSPRRLRGTKKILRKDPKHYNGLYVRS